MSAAEKPLCLVERLLPTPGPPTTIKFQSLPLTSKVRPQLFNGKDNSRDLDHPVPVSTHVSWGKPPILAQRPLLTPGQPLSTTAIVETIPVI